MTEYECGVLSGNFVRLEPLAESHTAGLAQAAGATVVLRVLQERPKPDPASFLGRGKVDMLAEANAEAGVDVVIVDHELSPTQLEHLASVASTSFNLSEAGAPERVAAERVSADFFRVFRIAPRLGRGFSAEEDVPGRHHVVVLGEGLWRRRFGADPSVLGRALRLGNETYTVVGVMPAGFDPLMGGAQLWVPLALTPEQRYLAAIAADVRKLLKEGKTLEEATKSGGFSEREAWKLFDQYHVRNVSATFAELEWE